LPIQRSIFFGEDDFKEISIPVQIWTSERGGAGVSVQSVGNVLTEIDHWHRISSGC
jgi:hypothetical protein